MIFKYYFEERTYHGLFLIKFLSTESLGTSNPLAFTESRVNFFLQCEVKGSFRVLISLIMRKNECHSHYEAQIWTTHRQFFVFYKYG